MFVIIIKKHLHGVTYILSLVKKSTLHTLQYTVMQEKYKFNNKKKLKNHNIYFINVYLLILLFFNIQINKLYLPIKEIYRKIKTFNITIPIPYITNKRLVMLYFAIGMHFDSLFQNFI